MDIDVDDGGDVDVEKRRKKRTKTYEKLRKRMQTYQNMRKRTKTYVWGVVIEWAREASEWW